MDENNAETTEVTVAGTQAVAAYQEPFETGLDIDPNDMVIPRIYITQPMSVDVKPENVGKFFVKLTSEHFDTFKFAVLKNEKTRIMFPDKFIKDNDPLCRSHDFKTPANDIDGATPLCDTCALAPKKPGQRGAKHYCEYANWGADNSAPRCSEVQNILIVNLETYMPMWFACKKTALRPVNDALQSLQLIGRAKHKKVWEFGGTLALKEVVYPSGKAYVPVFSDRVLLEGNDLKNMKDAALMAQYYTIKDSDEQDLESAPESAEPQGKF